MKRIFSFILCFALLCGCGASSIHESETPESDKLRLACWIATPQVTYMVSQYNRLHPEMPIEIKEYRNPDIDSEQSLAQMNADLVSGEYADLYCFGSLDLQSLINAGLIADLAPFISQDSDFTDEKYYMDIMSMFYINDHLYEMPCFFQIAGICLPSTSVPEDMTGWTFENYINWDTTLAAEGKALLSMDALSMLDFLAQYSIDSYFDSTRTACQFENEDFYQLLNFTKYISNADTKEPIGLDTWVMGILSYINDIETLGTQPKYLGYPSVEANGPCVMSLVSYGISSSTEYPEACWEFIKLTLSDDAYLESGISEAFPLSRNALDEAIKRFQLKTDNEQSPLFGMTDMNGDYFLPLDDTYVPYIYELLDSVTHARFRYSGVYSIIHEEGMAFLEEDKSAEETAKLIQNRVQIYLSEQN